MTNNLCKYCNQDKGHRKTFCSRSCQTAYRNKTNPTNKGKTFSKEWKANIGKRTSERTYTEETKAKISESGRLARINLILPYRQVALRLYLHECWNCKRSDISGYYKQVHHINGDKSNSHPDNLVILCAGCHNNVAHLHVRSVGTKGTSHTLLRREFLERILEDRGIDLDYLDSVRHLVVLRSGKIVPREDVPK